MFLHAALPIIRGTMEEHTENPWAARKAILSFLYDRAGEEDPDCKYKDPTATVRAGARYPEISDHTGLSLEMIEEIAATLASELLADWNDVWNDYGQGVWLQITATGIRNAEEERFVAPQQAEQREQAGLAILQCADERRRRHGKRHSVDLWDLLEAGGRDGHARRALAVLIDEDGFIERAPCAAYKFQITTRGREYLARIAEEEKRRRRLIDEFEQLEDLDPQPRGKALEGLLAEVLREQGFHCELDIRAGGEQIDLLADSDLASFVCEAKWEENAIEAGVIDHLRMKLARRPVTDIGVVFSMSGFTHGAQTRAIEDAHLRVVLLVGRDEILDLVHGRRRFGEMVREKRRALSKRIPPQRKKGSGGRRTEE
jgi:Restriction endonuclease